MPIAKYAKEDYMLVLISHYKQQIQIYLHACLAIHLVFVMHVVIQILVYFAKMEQI